MAGQIYNITIVNEQTLLAVDEAALQRTVAHVLEAHRIRNAEVNLAVVDNETIRPLKKQYFGIDEATDVISFDLSDSTGPRPEASAPLECEVIVNAEFALSRTGGAGGDPQAELHLYVVHGLLHQLGYDDATEEAARRMHAREDELLSELGYGSVYYGSTVSSPPNGKG